MYDMANENQKEGDKCPMKKLMRATGQFCLGIIGIVLFFIAVPVSLVGSRIIAHLTSSDVRYHLFDARRADYSWRKDWRIDATAETVEVMYKDHWGKHGNFWVKIPSGTTSIYSMGIHDGENGEPFKVSIDVNTRNGKVTGHDFIPAGDSPLNGKFIGSFHVLRQ